MLKNFWLFPAGIILTAVCFTIWRGPDPDPKIIIKNVPVVKYDTVTKTVPVEKIVYRDPTGQIVEPDIKTSFTAEVPFQSKIVTPDLEIEFGGSHLVKMQDDVLSVEDKLDPDIKEILKLPAQKLNEVGPYYSTQNGAGIYFRRYISAGIVSLWGEIKVPFGDCSKVNIAIGLPVRF